MQLGIGLKKLKILLTALLVGQVITFEFFNIAL